MCNLVNVSGTVNPVEKKNVNKLSRFKFLKLTSNFPT